MAAIAAGRAHAAQQAGVRQPASLAHALGSDVIKRMRADFVQFPPFAGGNKHFPMLTRVVRLKP